MFSALIVPDHRWTSNLKSWREWRRTLNNQHKVPTDYELHSQEWLSSSPKPVDIENPGVVEITTANKQARALRFKVFENSLRTIGSFVDVQLLTVHAVGTGKYELYRELLLWIEEYLEEEDDLGLVILDGLDQGSYYRECHRELDINSRRIIEDPTEMHSHGSHWIQMADACVHAAYQAVKKSPNRDERFHRAYGSHLERIILFDSGDAENGIRFVDMA